MEPELVQTFMDEYHAELQRLQKEHRTRRRAVESERVDLQRQITGLVDAIADSSVPNVAAVGEKLRVLEERLLRLPAPSEEPTRIDWHPKAVDI